MNRFLFFVMIIFSSNVYGQIDNRWQPESVYQNRKVKKIFAYLNSPKDLSEIIDFDGEGHKLRVIRYSASYNTKTRQNKRIEMISSYKYDSNKKLIQITDSTYSTNNTYFYYDSTGKLTTSKYFRGLFKNPDSQTTFSYKPFKSTTTKRNDSIIIYCNTAEYENEFYSYKSYGYSLEPKLKDGYYINGSDTSRYQYSDYKNLQRFEQNEIIKNKYNLKGQLISAEVRQTFLIDRKFEGNLTYTYYSDGLLKSIRGYVPEYFKYEFWGKLKKGRKSSTTSL